MSEHSRPYAIDNEAEFQRLETQARLGQIEDHLKYLEIPAGARVLDAGCGPGSMARLMARAHPDAEVTGIDQRELYLDYARTQAKAEGLANIAFRQADVFELPFPDATFDVVWNKYLLQWLKTPKLALAELQRVTKPGGLVVSCDLADFMIEHHPVDAKFADQIYRVMTGLVDPNVGRKVAGHMIALGLQDITVDAEADRAFTMIGTVDRERRWNWEEQWRAARTEITDILGSEAETEDFLTRFFAHLDDPATCSFTTLYFTRGRRPA